ncbi:MAG TPA: hypothetical protein VIV40_40955 [Kofleriaceae bacterium]
MRVLACALATLTLVGALATVAGADDSDDDEDGNFVPLPKLSIGFSFGGHGTRIAGMPEGGVGPALELALGGGRWQYFIESGFASSNVTTSADLDMVSGRMLHGGLGARWLARQFRPERGGGIELFLSSRIGVERFSLEDGTRLSRPELAFGFGLQGRLYKRPRLAFRLDARLLFTPADNDSALVACNGRCMEAGASTGFATGVGFAW